MPTYEYACRTCGARFEAWQKITDDPIETCPTCGNPVHRVLYPVGLVFKGGGFYKTDSRGASAAAEPAGEVKASDGAPSEAGAKDGATKPDVAESGESKSGESKSGESKSMPAVDKPVAAASGE